MSYLGLFFFLLDVALRGFERNLFDSARLVPLVKDFRCLLRLSRNDFQVRIGCLGGTYVRRFYVAPLCDFAWLSLC